MLVSLVTNIPEAPAKQRVRMKSVLVHRISWCVTRVPLCLFLCWSVYTRLQTSTFVEEICVVP